MTSEAAIAQRIRKLLSRRYATQPMLEQAVQEAGDRIVYFIQAGPGGPIKIGTSRRSTLKGRLGALQSGSAFPLSVTRVFPGGKELERKLHRLFREARMEGEWFWPIELLCAVAHATIPPSEVAHALD